VIVNLLLYIYMFLAGPYNIRALGFKRWDYSPLLLSSKYVESFEDVRQKYLTFLSSTFMKRISFFIIRVFLKRNDSVQHKTKLCKDIYCNEVEVCTTSFSLQISLESGHLLAGRNASTVVRLKLPGVTQSGQRANRMVDNFNPFSEKAFREQPDLLCLHFSSWFS